MLNHKKQIRSCQFLSFLCPHTLLCSALVLHFYTNAFFLQKAFFSAMLKTTVTVINTTCEMGVLQIRVKHPDPNVLMFSTGLQNSALFLLFFPEEKSFTMFLVQLKLWLSNSLVFQHIFWQILNHL